MSLYNDASLAMIPSAYKDGKLYSIKPSDGSGDFTFSRGSNLAATRVNASGLIEKGRENLLLQSNQFDTTWVTSNTSVTGGQAGYDGSSDAWLLSKSAASASLRQSISSSGVHSFSIYAKAGSLNWVALQLSGGVSPYVYFDLSTGNIGTQSNNIDAIATSIGGGWYRISIVASNAVNSVYIYPADGDNDLSGTSGSIYIQDAQLEAGLVATDYIETTTTTAQAGILEDMPRLDYSGGASCPSLLLEPQRTNLMAYSEYFLHPAVTYTNASGTANAAISPEGVENAHKLQEDSANSRHRFYVTGASAGAGNIVVSGFLKDGNRGYGALHLDTGSDGRFTIIIDLSNGAVVDTMTFASPNVIDYGVEDYGNGWYRGYIVLNKTSTANVYPQIGLASSDSDANSSGMPSYQGDGTHYIYCYGLQVEENSSYPTSYIPCYGAATSRSEDSCTKTGISSLIGQEQGTLFVDFVFNGNPTSVDYNFMILGSLGSNYINVGAYNTILYARVQNTSLQANINALTMVEGTRYKVAVGYAENDVVMYVNGVNEGTDTSVSIPAVSQIGLTRPSYAQSADVNQAALFKTRLTNGELAALTTI